MTPEIADHIARHPLIESVVRVDRWVQESCVYCGCRAAGPDGLCTLCYRRSIA